MGCATNRRNMFWASSRVAARKVRPNLLLKVTENVVPDGVLAQLSEREK